MPRPARNTSSSAARPNSRSTRSTSPKRKLRYMMGLAASDGRLIRPKDEPTTAKVTFDWCDVLDEGLVRSVELRQQKWIVKRARVGIDRRQELLAAQARLRGPISLARPGQPT